MHRLVTFIAAVAVLLCVFVIFAAPSVDLPDTNVRSRQVDAAILHSMATLVLIALLVAGSSVSSARLPAVRSTRPSSQLTC